MQLFAHGFGGVKDLPIPLWLAITAAVGALVVSFVVLALTTRPDSAARPVRDRSVPLPRRIVDSTGWVVAWRVVGVLIAAYTAYVAIWSPDLATNPLFGIFYVLMWVGVVFASLLFGEVWKAISPVRAVAEVLYTARGTREPLLRYPERLGMWPATLGLLAFTWLELVHPDNDFQSPVRTWLTVYVAVMIVGGQIWGDTFYENCDPFEVYSSLMARLSPWARVDGRLVLRRPLANLDATPTKPGQVAVLAILFGTIAYDAFHESVPWFRFTQASGWSNAHPGWVIWVNDAGLIGFPLVIGLFYMVGTMCTGVGDVRRRDLPAALAPSLIPIVAGYVVAHYLSYFWLSSQLTLQMASDPNHTGADWFGTSDMSINTWLLRDATFLAVLKVLAVVIGHILGVISAHKRALRVLPREHVVTGQLPLLVTMIGLTGGGLYLLFST
ncbi:hypothetical protein Back2_09970 [Nocardioides baekrokdamisoli]|uniref:Fenitrothion hydrolase n=1 Tax=Nocardioides baekrokdamisoli TaxID=1804624 RepID=A0A3G9ICN4_9ACTN|nr:hypothetical protein [Nocardioides baekrokdamisoli]BBH16710.1 hypothetical protein Back2_09970 [Nocardioides baekrokdamisoli]